MSFFLQQYWVVAMTTAELGTLVGCIENKRLGIPCTRVLFLTSLVISSAKDNIYSSWTSLTEMHEPTNENTGITSKFELFLHELFIMITSQFKFLFFFPFTLLLTLKEINIYTPFLFFMKKGKSDEITRVLTKAGGGCETLGGGGWPWLCDTSL